ncbi:MAG: hypothetical protein M3N98_08495 [Actinomycetota bacterium]|nr:hypothetical protein [Actinomycetota bacterium]
MTTGRQVRSGDSDAGTSLLEVVMVLALVAVVLPSAFSMVVSAQQASSITTNRFSALGSAQIIMDRITKDLRAGVGVIDTTLTPQPSQPQVFLAAGPRDIQFYSALADANGPSKLHAYTPAIAATNYDSFNEDIVAANTGGATPYFGYGTTWGTRIEGRYVSPAGPVFSFYSRDGTRLDDGVHNLASSVLPSIDAVGIMLTTTVNPGAATLNPLTAVSAMVHVRNVDYNPNGG